MAIFGQISLLFRKNFLLRIRYPGIIVLELAWPILVMGLVALMRNGAPPFRKPNCHYQPRAMPSAGTVAFLQTYLCNLDNPCYVTDSELDDAIRTTRSFSAMTQDAAPYLSSPETMDILDIPNGSIQVINSMNSVIRDQNLTQGLDTFMNVSQYFRDPGEVKRVLVDDFGLFTPAEADALLNSRLNVGQLMRLTGSPDFTEVACDPNQLALYLRFPSTITEPGSTPRSEVGAATVGAVSRALCNITREEIPGLADAVLGQLDVAKIMEALQLFEELRERFTGSSLSLAFAELADMFELVMSSESVVRALGKMATVPEISELIREIPTLINGFSDLNDGLSSVKYIVDSLSPLMTSLGVADNNVWSAVQNAVQMGTHFVLLGEGKWNGTTQEFMQPMTALVMDLRAMAQDGTGQTLVSALEFLSQQNWPDIYNQIIKTATLDERTVVHMLDSLEQMLRTTQGFHVVARMSRLAQHALDVGSIFTEQTVELRRALYASIQASDALQERLNRFLLYGPEVTQAVLESLQKSAFFASLFTGSANYTSVCSVVVKDLETKVPTEVAREVRDVICTEDPMSSLSVLMGNRGEISAVSDTINRTVAMFTKLYEGEFWEKQVPLRELYHHYIRFTDSITLYMNDSVRWEDIFMGSGMTGVDTNMPGWESLMDMLNEDYLIRGILGVYQGFGEVLTGSPMTGDVAPYVHLMSRTMEMTYRVMHGMTQTYSMTSPLMTAVSMVTGYLPEMVQGIAHMTNTSMETLYKVAASDDPLMTFCTEDVLAQMAMPSYVPVGDMTDLVCNTNWTQVIVEFAQPVTQIQDMVTEIGQLVGNLGNPSGAPQYDVEGDWISMVDYTQRMIDLFNSGDFGNMDFTLGYLNYFQSIDFNKLGDGIGLVMDLLVNDTAQDMQGLIEVTLGVMENLDRSMGSNPGPEWRMVRVYATIADSYMDMQIALTESSTNISSIRGILSTYPPEFTRITELVAKAYPELVSSLRNIILIPEMFLDKLSALGFVAPDCSTRWFADYLMLDQTSSVHDLERYICGLDWDQLAQSLAVTVPEVDAFMEGVSRLTLDPTAGLNATVNWRKLATKIENYIALLNEEMVSDVPFDLHPFNATAISLSWEDLYRAIDTYRYFDPNRIQGIVSRLSGLSMLTDVGEGDAEIVAAILYSNNYISYHFTKLANAELSYFNSTDRVVLSEYLWSGELRNLLGYMQKSPDFSAVVMATVQRLLVNPEKAKLPTAADAERLCSDLQLFSQVFVVSASAMSPSDLQNTVCDIINFDFERALDEVQNNRASVREFIDAMAVLSGNFTVDDLRVDAVRSATAQQTLVMLIEDLILDPPDILITPDQAWLDMSAYTRQWDDLTGSLMDLGQRLQDPNFVRSYGSGVSSMLLTAVANYPSTGPALNTIEVVLDMVTSQLDASSGSLEELRKYPNANILLGLVEQAPEAIQTILYTVITQQDKTTRWGFALQSWSAFCSTPADDIMSVPPGLSFSMANFLATACSLDVEALAAEMAAYQGTDRLTELMVNGTTGSANVSSMVGKIDEVLQYFLDLSDSASGASPMDNVPFPRLFNETVWNRIGSRISVWTDMTTANYDSPAKIVETISQSLREAFGGLAMDVFEIVDKAIGVSDILLGQIIQMMDTNSLNASFYELPEMQTLASLLNEVPELFETVLYTAIQNPAKATDKLSQADSIESFCMNSPEDMLILPPNSTFDLQAFLTRFCTLNVTKLVSDIETYSVTQQVNFVLNGPYTGPADVDSLISKVEELARRLERGINPSDRVFDPSVWSEILGRTSSWIWDSNNSPTQFVQQMQHRLFLALVAIVDNTPGLETLYQYIDVILDVIESSAGSLDGLRNSKYPNANNLLGLVEQLPEAVETILYTVITQQDKTTRWGFALQSWSAFCSTPADDIMSVPPGLSFSMANFLATACSLDVEALAAEMAAYQGTDRLTELLTNGPSSSSNVNVTSLSDKLDRIVQYYISMADPSADPLASLPFPRLFDETVWASIGQRIEGWTNTAAINFDSPSEIAGVIATALQDSLGMLGTDVLEIVQRVVGVTDIVLTQMTSLMNTNSLNASFHELPELQGLTTLLNEVPELFETVLYTAINHPEKITTKIAQADSIESFCMNNPQDMLVLAPNSTFDLQAFLMQLCSLNLTKLVSDIETYSVTLQVNNVVQTPYTGLIDFNSLVSKAEQLVARLEQGITPGDRVFNPAVWEQVMSRVSTWIWTTDDPLDFVQLQQQRLFLSFIAYVENTAGAEDMLRYVDAVLDVIGNRIDEAQTDLASAVKDLPNLSIIVGLLEKLPEMIETAVYTTLTQPAKTSAWSQALTSFEALCSTPVSSIMSVPPGSSFDVTAYIGQLCSVDIDQLATELTQYQGFGRLEAIAAGNDTSAVNTTALLMKANSVFASLGNLYSNPDAAMGSDLRLLNATVWEHIGQRIQGWMAGTQTDFSQPENIVQAVIAGLESFSGMSPEVDDVLNRATAMAAVLVDDISRIIQETSLEDAYKGIPSLQVLIRLANEAPELYETIIYTEIFHPEKASSQAEAFVSLEAFCKTDPEILFTVPTDSTFDLNGWVAEFCSVNFTSLEVEVTSYQTAMDIERIVTDQPLGSTNLTSVVAKVTNLIERLGGQGGGVMLQGRLFSGPVWEEAMNRVEGWLANYTLAQSPLMSFSEIGNILSQLSRDPEMREALLPLTLPAIIGEQIMDRLLLVENMTSFGIVEFFNGWTSMEKILQLAQKPGALEIMSASAESPQFQSLFANQTAFADFCSPVTDPSDYLKSPARPISMDLQTFKTAFCAIDFENFQRGYNNFIDLELIERVMNGSELFDWTQVFDKVDRVIHLVSVEWMENPPEFYLPPHWMNESYWEGFFETNMASFEDTQSLKERLDDAIVSLAPLLQIDEFRQIGLILNSALGILNDNMVSMRNARLTLGNAVSSIPALKNLFDALGLDNSTMLALLAAPIKNTTQFAELLLSENFQADFCGVDKWRDVLSLPDDFDTSALYQSVCISGNVNPILESLIQSFNLQSLGEALDDPTNKDNGWTPAVDKIFELVDNVNALIKNPPSVDISDPQLQATLEQYVNNTDDLWKMLGAFSALQNVLPMGNGGTSSGSGLGGLEQISSVYNVPLAIIGVMTELMARLKVQNGNLDLASIFKGVPQVIAVVNSVLDLKPDPLTGIASVMLKANTVDYFLSIAENETALNELFCDQDKFMAVFDVRQGVDLDQVLSAMCALDFNTVAQQLLDSLNISALSGDTSSSGGGFNLDGFSSNIEKIIGLLMNITDIDHVTFDGRDFGDLAKVNVSRLAEYLNSQYNVEDAFTQDYVSISATILNDVLASLEGSGEVPTLALKFIGIYMKNFNAFLRTIKDQPISLQLLMNNTEVGNIVNPLLSDPHALDGLINAKVNVTALADLLQSADAEVALCGLQLWTAIQVPVNERQPLEDLQLRACAADQDVLLWQTIMLQANGFKIQQQLDIIMEEIEQGQTTLNVSSVTQEVNQFVSLVQTIIEEFVSGSRSVDDLLDVRGFQELLDSVQRNVAQRLLENAESWAIDTAQLALPNILDPVMYQNMAKTLNTANLFMNITIQNLQGIREGTVSLDTIFTDSDDLVALIESYLRLGQNIAGMWTSGEVDITKLTSVLAANMTRIQAWCSQTGGLAPHLVPDNFTIASQTVTDLATLICSAVDGSVVGKAQDFVSYQRIAQEIETIWSSPSVTPDYAGFTANVREFTEIVQELASRSLAVSSGLSSSLNFRTFLTDLQNIGENPQIIFRLLQLAGLAIDGPLRENEMATQLMANLNTFAILPMVNVLDALQARGVTLLTIDNPDKLFDMLEVMVDFKLHYQVIENVIVKSQLSMFAVWQTDMCDYFFNNDTWLVSTVSEVSAPVPWTDVRSALCQVAPDADLMLDRLKAAGLTDTQIVALMSELSPIGDISQLPGMYDRNVGWMEVMSNLAQLTNLVTLRQVDRPGVHSMRHTWDSVKQLIFNNSIGSVFSYLTVFESETQPTQEWIGFKQFMRFLSSALNFVQTNIDGFVSGGTVRLEDILPDSQRVASLLNDVFGQTSSAEILATAINPELVYRISISDSWSDLCRNGPENYLQFPPGVNVTAMTENLCQAVESQDSSFQELLSLFDASDMLAQLDDLMAGRFNQSVSTETILQSAHKAILGLVSTLEQLQGSNVDPESVEGYLNPLVNWANSLQTSQSTAGLVGLCNSMVYFVNETQELQALRSVMAPIMSTMKFISDVTQLIPELDELTCIFFGEDSYDLTGAVDKLADLGLWQDIEEIIASFVEPSSRLDCAAPLRTYMNVSQVIEAAMTPGSDGLDLYNLQTCLARAPAQLEQMLSSVTSTTTFLRQLVGIAQMPGLMDLLQNDDILPVIDFLVRNFNDTEQAALQLKDLLEDGNQAMTDLVDLAGLPMALVNSLLNATVTADWARLLSEPVQELAGVLCDVANLSHVLELPQNSPISVAEISQAVCTRNVLSTAGILSNMSLPLPEIEELLPTSATNLMSVVGEIAQQLGDLITEFGNVIELVIDLLTDVDMMTILRGQVDVLDDILQGKGLARMAEILHDILDSLVKVLPSNPETDLVIKDVRRILDGALALDVLRDTVIGEIQVKDLAKDPAYLSSYLTNQLNFPENVTQTIMEAVFSSRAFLLSSEASNITCEEVLQRILILNGTGLSVDTVRDAVCDLPAVQIERLLDQLVPQLDIGDLVIRYVTHTTESVLTSANLTTNDLDDLVETIDKGFVNLRMASNIITRNNGSDFLDAVFNASSTGAFSMAALTPSLCGKDVQRLFEPDFPTGSLILAGPDVASMDSVSQSDRIELEELDLPNEFCVGVYETVRDSNLGNILWAYLKPIMRGKILYTPDTPAVRAIIKEANATFETFQRVYEVSKMWADKAGNLKAMADTLQDVEALEDALQNDFVSSLVEGSLGISANSLLSSLDAVRSDNFNVSQIDALQTAAEFVANYTSCIETNRFQFVENEEELEREAFRLSGLRNFFAGIVFMDMDETTNSSRRKRAAGDEVPKHITYKLRMDVDNTMDTNHLKSNIWKLSAEDNFIEDMRYFRGFIHIQDMLDSAIIKLQKNEILDTPGTHIRQMPFPCHHLDNFVFLLGAYLVPVMMTFVFLASLGVATHNFVYDRENGQEATLGVMGMISGLNFIVWLVSTLLVMAFVCLVMAIMLKYTDVFSYSNLLIMFLYLLEFCFSSLMMLYMVSSFFTRTTMAILFVLMIYLISYMPYIVLVGLEVNMDFWEKRAACLSSTAAFSFGTLTLSYLEESGSGMQWDNLKKEVTRDFSMHWSFIMMAIDSGIYFLIGWYVRNVKPGKYGLSQPWYFPVSPSYWCGCLRWAIPRFRGKEDPNAGLLFESAPPGLNIGIALRNLTKRYGNSKRNAVDNLSVNFYENQITSLLGHNGAAKTTTLKMLYGVLEPTSGQVTINGRQPGCGTHSLGICPQQNALFDYMTVMQHMAFYTGIKGKDEGSPSNRAEARKLLKDVDLLHARHTPVKDLSYGMKRRLCVALAFVGNSKIIILDEPTSGVDPHGRKNIWNLITQNRMGRTILLSTHHLDEADILSDRIALLHQGKLLCCGSPSFLKRNIGHDFRLIIKKAEISAAAAEYDNSSQSPPAAKDKGAEQTEVIVGYVQSMCPDATLVEQVGTDLTFNLPKDPGSMRVPLDHFFRQLDSPQSRKQLQIDTYGVSDTTLEEVFLTLTMRADEIDQAEEERGILNPVMTTRDEAAAAIDPETPKGSNFKPGYPGQDKLLFSPAAKIRYGPNGGSLGFDNGLMQRMSNEGLQEQRQSSRIIHQFQYGVETSSAGSVDNSKRRKGFSLSFGQVGALLTKRFHHYRRNWRILVSGVVLPLICLVIALYVSTLRVDEGDMKALTLDPSIYGPGTYSFYQDSSMNTMSTSFTDTLTDRDVGYGTTCRRSWGDEYLGSGTCAAPSSWYNFTKPYEMVTCQNAWQVYRTMPTSYTMNEYKTASEDYIQHIEKSNVASYLLRTFRDYIDKRFGGFTFERNEEDFNSKTTEPYVWFNSKGYHSLPSFFNSMSNTILRAQLYHGKNKSEYGITAINHPIKLGKAALSVKNLEADASDAGVSLIIVVAFSFIPCGFLLYLINEKVQKERQLQNLRGVSVLTYWLVAIIWDMLVYCITVGCAAGIVAIFQTDGFYMRQNLGAFTTILLLYGWSVIPLLYCVSKWFSSGSTAYLVSFCLNLFLALSTVISLLVMQLFRDTRGAWEAYKVCKYAFLVFPQFALGQGLMDMVSNTFMYKLFERYDVDRYKDPYSNDVLGYNLIALGVQGVFFFILNLILDSMKGPNLKLPPGSDLRKAEMVSSEDDDVARERGRVKAGGRSDDMLVVQDLSKVYRQGWSMASPRRVAVDNITFGVPEGECFGLLGVNGAGKTTTFRMLTGDSRPASGTAFLKGESLSFNDKKFGHDIGYCPQEGGLDEYLTGEETLYFHARMKGFRPKQIKVMAKDLLERLGLERFANVTVHNYSGGTKRKLALAVALLGEPPILYLDEPTTGMDAVTRRLAWKCIAQANRNGQSVVLTSHSMGECDALCSRIAIMVNGQIKCIGSPQHLKNKFGDGHTVVIHTAPERAKLVTNMLLSQFPGAKMKHMHLSRVELLIPYQAGQVADIISYLQAAEDAQDIYHYSLSQTSLDSVFINFAQEQSDVFDELYASSSGISGTGTGTPSGSISSFDKPEQKAHHIYDNFGRVEGADVSSSGIYDSDTASGSRSSQDQPQLTPAHRGQNVYSDMMDSTQL